MLQFIWTFGHEDLSGVTTSRFVVPIRLKRHRTTAAIHVYVGRHTPVCRTRYTCIAAAKRQR